MTKIKPRELFALNLDIELQDSFLKCSKDKIRTPCTQNHFDKTFGTKYTNLFGKFMKIERSRLIGSYNFEQETKCLKPCYETQYKTKIFYQKELDELYSKEPVIQYMNKKGFDSRNTSILIIYHVKSQKILKMKQIYHYSTLQFIGDAGGTIGVFLGVSLSKSGRKMTFLSCVI